MTIPDDEIRTQLDLGEDSRWEFKQVEYAGEVPVSPSRDSLADEMGAFANAAGGILLCGVSDDGHIQDMSRAQMKALDHMLVEISTDTIDPPLRINVQHRQLDDKAFVLVEVPKGDAVHERAGRTFIRVGASKRRLDGDERLRLAMSRAQGRYLWFDQQVVPDTGFETLEERLWESLISIAGASDPLRALKNLRLLAQDEAGIDRATVAGVLLCSQRPQSWLPQATVLATHYRGVDRSSGQLDAQEITGPIPAQIAEAVKFVSRNMRVSARKLPERENTPQYSMAAVFEAVVNAVAHRDYTMSVRRIRLSMFSDRLEIDSPGRLPNGMTIEGMDTMQATRNEVIASVFGRIPVGDVAGTDHRRYLMERRGDGVSIILQKTLETAGSPPTYRIVDETNLVLTMPAAKLELVPADATVTVLSNGEPLPGADVLAIFPNKTWQRTTTDSSGEAALDLYTTHLPMTVYAAAPKYGASLTREWRPDRGGLLVELHALASGGSAIFAESTGHLPGLRGRLNPILDTSSRTYLYADNIAIEHGRQQPVPFRVGKPIRLTDAHGAELSATIIDIVGRSSLLEYRTL
ncbi:MAG: putative DNA binding domain-containing protein [Gammaproteobacteria bacterium]|nr:putative DNA binding domain-containing protein [Gammaproteobacteria bacterium]MCY4277606.1 putative DNA binding domain-containing protein [Gammaproteobacteria bacterium]MCY4324051.1 putative DNA binding domain-containing protein [Gammaproteobacteria bacterium]